MADRPRSAATVARRLGAWLTIAAISLMLGEAALRVANRVSPSYIFEDESFNRFRGRPGSVFYDFRLNSLGFNDREFELSKEDRFRIVALGDSFAFGVVPYPHNYLTVVEQLLDRGTGSIDVLNMGIPSTGPHDQLALLLGEGLRYDPDLVLLSFYVGNDYLDTYRRMHVRRTLSDRSYLLALLRHLLRVRSAMVPDHLYGQQPYDDNAPTFFEPSFHDVLKSQNQVFRIDLEEVFEQVLRQIVACLEDMARACSERGVAFTVVLIPAEVQVDPAVRRMLSGTDVTYRPDNTDFDRPSLVLAERLRQRGLDVLDLYPTFRAAAAGQRLYKPLDTHWNIAGNRLAAELIADHLRPRLRRAESSPAADVPR